MGQPTTFFPPGGNNIFRRQLGKVEKRRRKKENATTFLVLPSQKGEKEKKGEKKGEGVRGRLHHSALQALNLRPGGGEEKKKKRKKNGSGGVGTSFYAPSKKGRKKGMAYMFSIYAQL